MKIEFNTIHMLYKILTKNGIVCMSKDRKEWEKELPKESKRKHDEKVKLMFCL